MNIVESIKFLRSQGESLFSDGRFQECADNLQYALETICRVREIASIHWNELSKKFNAHADPVVQECMNRLSEICNSTGWATGWNKTGEPPT